jgi:hypothetical protein
MESFCNLAGKCINVASSVASAVSPIAGTASSVLSNVSGEMPILKQEELNAKVYLAEFSKYVQFIDSQQKRYGIELCALDRAKDFITSFREFLVNYEETKINYVQKALWTQWYRQNLLYHISYMNMMTNLIKAQSYSILVRISEIKKLPETEQEAQMTELRKEYACGESYASRKYVQGKRRKDSYDLSEAMMTTAA